MRAPAGSLLVLAGLAKPDQFGHDLLLGLGLETGQGEANHGGWADSQGSASAGVPEHLVQPLREVEVDHNAHPPLGRTWLRVANSRHEGILTVGGDKRETLGCLFILAEVWYTAGWRRAGPRPAAI